MKIAPSILSADFANLQRDVEVIEQGGADYVHIDVMDGQFVPNITFGPSVVAALRPITKLTLDVHLMIVAPERFIAEYAKAGADMISIHVESTPHIHRGLQMIKDLGLQAGVVINPGTSVDVIKPVLDLVDYVLVMTVNPGFGGQKFLTSCLDKVADLKEYRETNDLNYLIEVDGGVSDQTARACSDAGADFAVAGSFVYRAASPMAQIQLLKDVAG